MSLPAKSIQQIVYVHKLAPIMYIGVHGRYCKPTTVVVASRTATQANNTILITRRIRQIITFVAPAYTRSSCGIIVSPSYTYTERKRGTEKQLNTHVHVRYAYMYRMLAMAPAHVISMRQ
uniref:Uncharacterized protein n=1 Tax=Trichogramma kaykai TaxID=54128 RepID=A0ABD2X3Z6_9HYME